MIKPFTVSLKAGERIYLNGAIVRVDRKVVIEFLNDVTFLLEQHVMPPEQTTTPLRQLYFILQTMLIDPASEGAAQAMFDESYARIAGAIETNGLRLGLAAAEEFVRLGRLFDALKALRALFPLEDSFLSQDRARISRPLSTAQDLPARWRLDS